MCCVRRLLDGVDPSEPAICVPGTQGVGELLVFGDAGEEAGGLCGLLS